MTLADDTAPCALYQVYDDESNPLYYGTSANPFARLATHAATPQGKRWLSDIATVKITWFASRREARRAERAAVLRDQPWYCEQGVTVPWPEITDAPAKLSPATAATARRTAGDGGRG